MSALVTHKDTEGAPLAFSLENWRGKVPFFAAAKGISAVINVQASQLARTAMINPMFIIQLPPCPYGPFQYTGSGRRRHGGQFLLGHKSKGQYRQQDIYNEAANKTHDRGLAYVILALGPI